MALGSFWQRFLDILPAPARYIATVVDSPSAGRYTVQLPGGAVVSVKGAAGYSAAAKVFITNGVIDGLAPSLTVEEIEV